MSAGSILVVDDTENSRDLVSKILVAEGYTVRAADSGELALASVDVNPPELILLDQRMEGLDGLAVCRHLKANESTRDIPVIFLSASLDYEDRVEGLASGAVDFVNKPFRREELLVRLKTHLELARLRKDLERRVAERTEQLRAAYEQIKASLRFRKRIEDRLRESEQRFRSLADTAPAIIFMSDEEGLITYMNQWGIHFTGRTTEELVGTGYLDRVHPEDHSRAAQTIAAASHNQKPYQLEYRQRRFDGEYRWLAETGNPRFVLSEFAGHIGVMLDVTELKRSQDRALANQKLESLGVLTAGISHTFNNLASTILAHAELAVEEIPIESPAHESVATIANVALRASEIVKLLMAYAGQSESEASEPIELSSLIRTIIQLLTVSKTIVTPLSVNLSPAPTPIWANPGHIRQVVLNLILNASEALGTKPGTISISTEKAEVKRGSSRSGMRELGEGAYVLLQVSDTGCGMSEEVQAKIFDPFYSSKSLGRGLGLASVQGIVRSAGGAITVQSAVGQGSTFQVWLPVWNGRTDAENPLRARNEHQNGVILLIDDESEVRSGARNALEQEGFAVITAADSIAAIELFGRHMREIEVVILDQNLTGFSGQSIADEVRELKPLVRMLTTGAIPLDAEGDTVSPWHLPKPYRHAELVQTIREMMTAASPRRGN